MTLLIGIKIPLPAEMEKEVWPGVTLRKGNLIPWLGGVLGRMGQPALAVTLRNTIVIHERTRITAELLRHELAHVRQWKDPFFPIRYSFATLRYGYRNNPYEVEARLMESSQVMADTAQERKA